MKNRGFRSIALVLLIMLVLAGGANARGQKVTPIEPGPPTSLPDYIGHPAEAQPTEDAGVPQNPFLAPYPYPLAHSDAWMSDTAGIAGPLGRNPVTLSTDLAQARKHTKSWLIPAGNITFDSHGRPIVCVYGLSEAAIVMLDPDTLEVLTYYPLEVTPGPPIGEGEQKFLPSLWSIYSELDNLDQMHIVSGSRKIITLREGGTPSHPVFEAANEGYDLTLLVEQTRQRTGDPTARIGGVNMDFQGRYWLQLGGRIYVLNPATAQYPYLDLKYVALAEGEFVRNANPYTQEGANYVVTTKQMYRIDAGADDQPRIVWQEPYDTSYGGVRPGQYELGSGTTPTVLGEGKYVAITDNAEQLHVVVFRTDAELKPGQERIVCEVPVFDFPEAGAGANSNSLIGTNNSIVVQNTFDYFFDWTNESGACGRKDEPCLVRPSKPGFERIDIDRNGRGCTKVWVNREVTTTELPRYSTANGLIYTMDRKYDADNDVYAYYFIAIDFRTGEVAWEKMIGTGDRFDNYWAPLGIGPNGVLYGTVYGGVVSIRDTP